MHASNTLGWITRLTPALVLAVAGTATIACDKSAETVAAHHGQCDGAALAAHHTARLAAHHAGHAGMLALIPARAEDESTSDHKWSDGKNEVHITREHGKVVVRLNGDEIMNIDDADLFEAEIAGAHGQAARLHEMGRNLRERMRAGMAPLPPDAPAPPLAWSAGEAPKVMIGVTMETAEEAGAKVPAGVEPDEATVITRVVEGLPAEKAGLKEGDIVIRVNGESPASPSDIREAIREMEPGNALSFRVSREGAEQDISITLDKYDGHRLGSPRSWSGSWSDDDHAPQAMSEEDIKHLDELRAQMDQTSAQLAALGQQLARAKDNLERERLGLQMEELGSKMGELGSEMGELSGGDQWQFFTPGEHGMNLRDLPRMRIERGPGATAPRAFVIRPDGRQGGAAGDDRVEQLEKKLENIEKLLEKMLEEKNKN